MNKRVFLNHLGKVFATNHVITEQNTVVPVAETDRVSGSSLTDDRKLSEVQTKMIKGKAHFLTPESYAEIKARSYQSNPSSTMNNLVKSNNFNPSTDTVQAAKITGEQNVAAFRPQSQKKRGGTETVTLTLLNNSGAQVIVPVFDPNSYVAFSRNIAAVPGTVVVGGTYGVNTLTVLRNMSATQAVQVDQITFNANNEAFYNAGAVEWAGRSVGQNPVGENYRHDFNANLDAGQFNPRIQKDTAKHLITPEQAMLMTLPSQVGGANTSLTITFQIGSIERIFDMELVGA
jgi:hypothetical protein